MDRLSWAIVMDLKLLSHSNVAGNLQEELRMNWCRVCQLSDSLSCLGGSYMLDYLSLLQ